MPFTHQVLVDRILRGPGEAPADQRARAFHNAGAPDPVRGLIEKVATDSAAVTDADFAAARDAGYSDDAVFELVICAAVGGAARRHDAALAALDEAEAG
jgi:alkylhydroperoxidase family enzyme